MDTLSKRVHYTPRIVSFFCQSPPNRVRHLLNDAQLRKHLIWAPQLRGYCVARTASVVLPNLVCTPLETNYVLHALRSERDHVQSDSKGRASRFFPNGIASLPV